MIPAELIERVEVLTGGASSTYGADAVSGVVNFIMNTHYEGVKLDAQLGDYNHSNHESLYQGIEAAAGQPAPSGTVNSGQQKDVSFIAGSNFADGAGNATVYATYDRRTLEHRLAIRLRRLQSRVCRGQGSMRRIGHG